MSEPIVNSRPVSSVRRWPLVLIAAPAAVAIWSGWVGLGGLCGFGVIHPLPGIWDSLKLNTAITLPVGVEAYGAYALGIWMRPGAIPGTARTFARRSAVGALVLGMTGQVAYHLLAAAHRAAAPWPVTVLVSCLPVVVLGFGAGLTHLLRAGESLPEAAATAEAEAGETPAELPEPEVATSAEEAARVALAASIRGGNPLTRNQLVTKFGLSRPDAARVHAELLPPAPEAAADAA